MISVQSFACLWIAFVLADYAAFLWCYNKMRLTTDIYSLNGFILLYKYWRGKNK